jgi:hypothetical protein
MVSAAVSARRFSLLATPAAAILLAGVLWSVSACGGETVLPTTSTVAAPTAPTASTTVPDGVHFGFVTQVTEDSMEFIPAEWFSGDAAVEAARADGFIGPDDELDDPYYIRDSDSNLATLEVDPAAQFTLNVAGSTGDLVGKTVSITQLAQLWAGDDDGSVYYAGFPAESLPMDLTVSNGRVTEGTEKYMP